MQHLTICYVTCRQRPRFNWFAQSIWNETKDFSNISFVIVDFHAIDRPLDGHLHPSITDTIWVPVKPNVWNGQFRLTKENWFAASNARNTGLCYAKDGWIAYVDDLSVLQPGWLNSVREAMAGNYIACGAYQKVKKLRVEEGVAVSYESFPVGVDSRLAQAGSDVWPCTGSWMFGCSLAAPVEALLTVNGWDENADGLGSEDYCMGIRLQNAGYTFRYDKRMMTLESEEAHFEEKPFRRTDKGVSPNDKSHAILKMAMESKYAPNYFGEGGIRAVRERALNGWPFPITGCPTCDWFDGEPISQMI